MLSVTIKLGADADRHASVSTKHKLLEHVYIVYILDICFLKHKSYVYAASS
jgi:hypothetical protein